LSLVKRFFRGGQKRLAGDTGREASSDGVKLPRSESSQLKQMLTEAMMENRVRKRCARQWGGHYMKYATFEKLEIIQLV
jgi:transposase